MNMSGLTIRRLRIATWFAVLVTVTMPVGAQEFDTEINTWRADREARLTAEDGWLTVAGLFFLTEGTSSFGTSPLNDIVLSSGQKWLACLRYAMALSRFRL